MADPITPAPPRARSYARPTAAALAALALAACRSQVPVASPAELGAWDPASGALSCRFEGAPGTLPRGWALGTSNGPSGPAAARWELVADPAAPSAPTALALVDARGHADEEFNVCWTDALSLADVEVTVAVRADGGIEDQGGGPAWRVAGPEDYYLARWNPLEDNFRVYSVKGGERRQLDSARVFADPAAWHVIRVRHVGDEVTCWFDGEELLHTSSRALAGPGGVGLWTKADATTRFDDLAVRPAR